MRLDFLMFLSFVVSISLAATTLATPARADVPAPERAICNSKNAGDSCAGSGKCMQSTCRSGGAPLRDDAGNPIFSTYPCLMCVGGDPGKMGGPSGGGSDGAKSGCAGCSVVPRDSSDAPLVIGLVIGALVIARGRRSIRR